MITFLYTVTVIEINNFEQVQNEQDQERDFSEWACT